MASVRRLLLAKGHDEELGAFRRLLQPRISSEKLQIDVTLLSCESPVLQFDSDDECRNNSQSLLEDLLLYLVVRKFRATTDSAGGKVILGIDQQISVDWEGRDVAEFQSFVDVLHGLLLDNEWDATAISSLNKVVKRIQDPRARQRFLTFAFQILRQASQSKAARAGSSPPFDVKFFDEAVRLLLLGVTDLWSAIRKDCAKNAAAIAFEFPSLNHIEQFMDSLLGVAVGSRSVSADKTQVTAWTEREGALLALSDLLRSIKMDSTSPQPENPKTSQVKEDIKGILGVRQSPAVRYRLGLNERHTFTQLPRCLVQTLKPAIYQCLRHDQLTVRQLAAQCLVEYAALCETPTRLLIFQEVISKLNRMNRNDKVDESDGIANTSESELLDAFEAEGLLDVLARMAPCLPSRFLLRHWKFVFPTLEKYVMHIASSVRQKSSSVVLALAKLGLSGIQQGKSVDDELEPSANSAFDEASLKLIVQMLLSLSNKRRDAIDFCWQQREGRLLSIEVLMNVLGESLVTCQSNELLRWKPVPTNLRQGRSTSLSHLQAVQWAHDQAQRATWVLNDNEVEEEPENLSIVQVISDWVDTHRGQNDLPASSQEFWQQILSGCIAHTKEAFESSQFELRRISRQLLPGLMRLIVWTDQLEFLSSTEFQSGSADTPWCCACAKFTLLHLRYLQESVDALGSCASSSLSQKLVEDWTIVWDGIAAMEMNPESFPLDTETAVGQVEIRLLAFLCFGGTADPPRQLTQLLDGALRAMHANLPQSLQLGTQMGNTVSANSSLDRQFSIFLVPMLPVVVSTMHYVAETVDSTAKDDVQPRDFGLSWYSRWLCLERIILSWLLCDDMFRWITMNKSEAQSSLLESLSMLLHSPNSHQLYEEFDKIVQCLSDTFGAPQTKIKDATYTNLLDLYLQMWLSCTTSGNCNKEKLLVAIASLYSQRQQALTVSGVNGKQNSALESWDNWDEEEEIQQPSPVGEMQEPNGVANQDALFQEVLRTLDASQLTLLHEAACATPSLEGTGDLSCQHVTRMQQQIDACLQL